MKSSWLLCGAVALAAIASGANAAQIVLTGSAVIGSTGNYGGATGNTADKIFDQQTGPVSESAPGAPHQWLNSENGPANAYITIDLGAAYAVSSFDLFNTHNTVYGDRGTGNFSIVGANAVARDGTNGFTLAGPETTLVAGTLAAAPVSDPIAAQSFTSSSAAGFRYLQFLPTSEASVNPHCCSAHEYGLSELRVFGSLASATPEPASWALMLAGFGVVGGVMRRRAALVSVAA